MKDERDGVEYRHSTNISGHCRRDGSKRHGRYFYYETFQKEKRWKTIEEVKKRIDGTLPIGSLKDIVNVLFCFVFQAYARGLEGHHPH